MTNDETQRNMDFIVAHRKQFREDMRRLKKRDAQATKRFAKTEDLVTQLEGAVLRLTQRMIESRGAE